jgi:hypothetical protein
MATSAFASAVLTGLRQHSIGRAHNANALRQSESPLPGCDAGHAQHSPMAGQKGVRLRSLPWELHCLSAFGVGLAKYRFAERNGRKGPSAENKARCNRTKLGAHATQQGYATQSEAEPDTPNPHTGRETGQIYDFEKQLYDRIIYCTVLIV